MDDQSIPQDAPVAEPTTPEPQAPVTDEPQTDAPQESESPQEVQTDQPTEAATAEQPQIVDEEDYGYPDYQLPPQQAIDFNSLPVGEDGLIDPNVLAQAINQGQQAAEERAFQRAQLAFQEQQAETRAWEKAYEKYPDLKGNKDLRDMVQNNRMGAITAALTRPGVDPSTIKLQTPMQAADALFKHITTAKSEGMKQATTNTVVQQSAYTESAARRTNDSGEQRTKAFQNINNPNKEVATKARQDLLKSLVFGES